MKKSCLLGTVCACMLFASLSVNASTVVYSNDFDGSEVFGSGVTGSLTGVTTAVAVPTGYANTGIFSGSMLFNDSVLQGGNEALRTTLTLMNLPAHDSIDINFALAIIDSWDSTDGGSGNSPDYFNVTVGGVSIFKETYANASGNTTYSDPDNTLVATGNLGFATGMFFDSDRAYNASIDSAFNVPHSGSALIIEWFTSGAGWQGTDDESWGMDNLSITITSAVPIPAALWLFGSGLLGLVGMARRKKAA